MMDNNNSAQGPNDDFLWLLSSFVIILSIFLTSLTGFFYPRSVIKERKINQTIEGKVSLQETPVLGTSQEQLEPKIYISGAKEEGYGSGGVVSLASTDEPAVVVFSYNISGNAEISIYKVNDESNLLGYLVHDDKNKQFKKNPDISKLEYITTFNQNLAKGPSGYGNETRLTLPIGESGIWLLAIKTDSVTEYAYVLRSNVGVIAKEGDNNEFIFWGQNFKTKRSITEGSLKMFNLQDSVKELASVSFDGEGIAKAPISAEVDVALVYTGDDRSLVPVNLHYLNSGYGYKSFQPRQKTARFFIFTDRPLYQPGDTIYFKTVLRADDDARYSVPSGQATVQIKVSGEENNFFEKKYTVSENGTIFGECKLSNEARTGYYYLTITLDGYQQGNFWYGWDGYSANYLGFQVEYFRKPEYSLEISVPKTEMVAGDKLAFEISGDYFSGQPLIGQEVKYKVYSADYYTYQYWTEEKVSLGDDYRYGYWGAVKTIQEGTGKLNGQGKILVDLQTQNPGKVGRDQVFSLEAEIDDGSGNPAFSRKNILVYAGEYGIYRRDSVWGAKIGDNYTLPIELVAHEAGNLAGISLTAKIHRQQWISYQEENKKYLSYRKEEEDLPEISTKTDSEGRANFSFTPAKVGSYRFMVEGKDRIGNLITNQFYVWVSQEGYFWTGEEEQGLTIRADREKYTPKDSVRLTISSEVADRDVLLALERAAVHRFWVVRLEGKAKTMEIPLAETDIPNIYATALSFSSYTLDSDTLNLPVSTGGKKLVVQVTPDKETFGPSETVTLNIQTTDIGGNPVAADLGVWAIDKALYELVDKKPRDIFQNFWRERYHGTVSSHSLEGITIFAAEGGGCFAEGTKILMADGQLKDIEKIKPGDEILTRRGEGDPKLVRTKIKNLHSALVGGYLIINTDLRVTANHLLWINSSWQEAGNVKIGDSLVDSSGNSVLVSSVEWQKGKFLVYNLEIDKYKTFFANGIWVHNQKGDGGRRVFKDTAYWNPSVRTNSAGQAKLTFKLPDNLTTWVVSAIGATPKTVVGQVTKEIIVTKEVIVRPILPNILRTDEEVVLSALVQNFTESDQKFEVDLKFDAGEVKNPTFQDFQIKSNEIKQVYWHVFPKEEKATANLTFSVRSTENPDFSDTVVSSLPVYAFGFWDQKGFIGDGDAVFSIKPSYDADRKKSRATFSLAASLVGTLPEAMKYLIYYPYGCTEQTTSSFVPALIAKENPDLFASALADKDLDDVIKKGIKRLASLQLGDGGWTWWHAGRADPFVTAYVVEYLLKAGEVGAKVDSSMLERARSYLEGESYYDHETKSTKSYSWADRIPKIYALSLLGSPKGKVLIPESALEDKEITPELIAMAVMANRRNGDKNPQSNGLAKLISLAKPIGEGELFWDRGDQGRFGSIDASTAFAIRAIIFSGQERGVAVKAVRNLTRSRKTRYWSNTFATAQTIHALVEFSRDNEELTPNYTYEVTLDGKKITEGQVIDAKKPIKEIEIPFSDIAKGGSKLALVKKGEGQLYSTLVINEYHTDKKAKAESHGIKIEKEFVSDRGEEYSIAVGDTITVKLTLNLKDTDGRYGVISDDLPAGLIPINYKFKNEQYGENTSFWGEWIDREITQNGALLSLYRVQRGEKTYSYKARAVNEGVFSVPPATSSLMYEPEISARSNASTLKVTAKPQIIPEKLLQKKLHMYSPRSNKKLIVGLLVGFLVLGGAVFYLTFLRKVLRKTHSPVSSEKTNEGK